MSTNNTIEEQLKKRLEKIVQEVYHFDLNELSYVIESPKDCKNGDYATNVAMQLTKVLKINPRIIASSIIELLKEDTELVEKIEVAGPGFINFFIRSSSITSNIKTIIENDWNYGKSTLGNGVTYNVEFVSANPTGDLHLGHARQAAIGDSICRLLHASGYKVVREYYINDAGNQIIMLTNSVLARYHQLYEPAYPFPLDGYHAEDIVEIARKVDDKFGKKFLQDVSKESLKVIRDFAVEYELNKIKKDLQDFRVVFDVWSSETEIRNRGVVEGTLQLLKDIGYTFESEGATWFKTTAFIDDKDRVLVKSDGSYTYLLPDIAYHADKLSRGYDYLVNLLGADHHGYINRIKAAIMALGHDENKLNIDIVQMVRLIQDGQEVKMSKRSGKAITLRVLCEDIGVDAVRYIFASRSPSSHLDFDLDLATKQSNENPVFYAQYAHARICSIQETAKQLGIVSDASGSLLKEESEITLVKHLNDFSRSIVESATTRSPFKMANYIQRLAQLFHSFYGECRVIDQENLKLTASRLALVDATRIVLRNALDLIGVSAPEKM